MLCSWYSDNLPSATRRMLTSASLLWGKYIGYVTRLQINRTPYIIVALLFKNREAERKKEKGLVFSVSGGWLKIM